MASNEPVASLAATKAKRLPDLEVRPAAPSRCPPASCGPEPLPLAAPERWPSFYNAEAIQQGLVIIERMRRKIKAQRLKLFLQAGQLVPRGGLGKDGRRNVHCAEDVGLPTRLFIGQRMGVFKQNIYRGDDLGAAFAQRVKRRPP